MQQPHDRLFRRIFSQPEHAVGELQHMLQPELVTRSDWSTLTLLPYSGVDEKLRDLRSDLLFSVECGGRPLLLYVLMEHQSRDERFMALRLLGYMVRAWEDWRRDNPGAEHLPPIVPLVVSHDERGWRSPRSFEDLLDIPLDLRDALEPQMVRFEMLVDDLTKAKNEELWGRAMSGLARATLFCLKRARQSEDLAGEMLPYAGLLRGMIQAGNHSLAALGALLRYILEVNDTPPERVRELAQALGPKVEEAFMTGEQVLLQRGRAEGRAEGKAEGTLRVLTARKLAVTPEQRARIMTCTDLDQLDRWLERAVTAATTDDIFVD